MKKNQKLNSQYNYLSEKTLKKMEKKSNKPEKLKIETPSKEKTIEKTIPQEPETPIEQTIVPDDSKEKQAEKSEFDKFCDSCDRFFAEIEQSINDFLNLLFGEKE